MIKKEIKLYNFEELSEELQEKIIEKNRYMNVEFFDWYWITYENFIEDLKKQGFYTDKENVDFSGFSCQGDGASFTGYIDLLEYLKYKNENNKTDENIKVYELFKKIIDNGYIENEIKIERNSLRYCHVNTCKIEDIILYDYDDFNNEYSKKEKENIEISIDELEKELEKIRYNHCMDLYKNLENDYNLATSNETIKEYLIDTDDEIYLKNGEILGEL